MTPAINFLQQKNIRFEILQYEHDNAHPSYGMEAVEKLGLDSQSVFKTLVVQLDRKELAVAVIPVAGQLSMKQMARALGGKKAAMAEQSLVEKTTGYQLGGISPLGQKKRLRTVLDASAVKLSTLYVSAGRRGLEIAIAPDDLGKLTAATIAELSTS